LWKSGENHGGGESAPVFGIIVSAVTW
jgi:hypothetical protein